VAAIIARPAYASARVAGSRAGQGVTRTAYWSPPCALGVRISPCWVARQQRCGWITAATSRPGLDVGCHGPIVWRRLRPRPR
jgi:hypothetical protein